MTPQEIFDALGIKASIMAAGFAGGVLRALSRRTFKLREMIASPICGVLGAAYLTDPAIHYLRVINWPLPPSQSSTEHALGFLVGVSAMWIADLVFDMIAARIKRPQS